MERIDSGKRVSETNAKGKKATCLSSPAVQTCGNPDTRDVVFCTPLRDSVVFIVITKYSVVKAPTLMCGDETTFVSVKEF